MAVIALPRMRLAALPTPLVRAERAEAVLGAAPIWVKRDDLTGFAFAGNKARKLEFLVADALERASRGIDDPGQRLRALVDLPPWSEEAAREWWARWRERRPRPSRPSGTASATLSVALGDRDAPPAR